jgi:hypothetical protein
MVGADSKRLDNQQYEDVQIRWRPPARAFNRNIFQIELQNRIREFLREKVIRADIASARMPSRIGKTLRGFAMSGRLQIAESV